MRKSVFLLSGALALHLVAAPAVAADKKKETVVPKGPSNHVLCDGYPNNMSAGESAARLLGAVTLLGIFAPAPESADPKARKFGKDGVAVCDLVLSGEKTETNIERKIELIQARAVHNIEAKDYEAALKDARLARDEATKAGLMNDAYYRRSVGAGFDQIEAAALIRMDKADEALEVSTRMLPELKYQYLSLTGLRTYPGHTKVGDTANTLVDHYDEVMMAASPDSALTRSVRLANKGRFAEAARLNEASLDVHLAYKSDQKSSLYYAVSALNHALAGDWEKAETRAREAKENMEARVAAGKPEENRSDYAEVLDLYEIVKLHKNGNVAAARRMFTGRSAWLIVPLGAVMEVNRRLSPGATPEEKIGMLGKTPEQMWQENKASDLAQLLNKDSDNETLFRLSNANLKAANWESYSKNVWNTKKKSKILLDPSEKNGIIVAAIFDYYGPVWSKFDAMLLHSALVAKSKGHSALFFNPIIREDKNYPQMSLLAQVRFGKAGDPGIPAEFALNPDDVIRELEPLIPSPETLKARKAAASKKKTS